MVSQHRDPVLWHPTLAPERGLPHPRDAGLAMAMAIFLEFSALRGRAGHWNLRRSLVQKAVVWGEVMRKNDEYHNIN